VAVPPNVEFPNKQHIVYQCLCWLNVTVINNYTGLKTKYKNLTLVNNLLGNGTFRYFANSPPGRFTIILDDLLPEHFAPLDVSIPGHFTTSLDVLPPDNKD